MRFQPHRLEHLVINVRDELDDLVEMGMVDKIMLSVNDARNAADDAFDQYLMWWVDTRVGTDED